MPVEEKRSFFKTLHKFPTEYTAGLITQYESERTGMRVIVLDGKGPKIHGYFTLATEIHDDSGAPHTLEHLIFMGSKNYTYKGVLDRLATRAYANTNAWTAVDHTAYNLDTAGWEGFAQILPVYLEHILLPTLTDSACYTEVHHIDGTGHDAGVVYSEMQGVQHEATQLMILKAQRLVYPENVGFRYETGGMMEQLRELSADRIRQFHREMYQPQNLCLIIVGEVDHDNLLEVLDKFEDGVLEALPKLPSGWKRPWTENSQAPPLKETVVETVQFPEEDESSGEISIAFLGPNINDRISGTALDVLTVYLAGSSAAVLENTLVEKEQIAGEVGFEIEERPNSLIWFIIRSVATDQLATVERRFFEVLKETVSKPLDMEYMQDCIRREIRQIKSIAEASPQSMKTGFIQDFLFGKRDGSTLRDLATLKSYDEIAAWSDEQWRDFLKRWISDAVHVSILGVPSAALSEKLKAREKARVEAQKARLGEEGLQELERKLAKAKAENDVPVPRDLLEGFKIPSVDSIHFINSTTARSGLARQMGNLSNFAQDIVNQDGPDLPLFIHFEHVETSFVYIKLVISTGSIPVEKRPLLPIFMENFFNCPIMRNGRRIEFEKVVTELEKDTISYMIDSGAGIANSELLQIDLHVEPEKYEAAVQWLTQLLWSSIFDEERLKSTVTKLLASIPEEKRSGSNMVYSVNRLVTYAPESVSRAMDTLVKAVYLKSIRELLQKDPQKVISELEEVRQSLCRLENFRILVVADVTKLKRPVRTWEFFQHGRSIKGALQPLDRLADRLSLAGKQPGGLAYLVPIPAIDSSYSLHTARCLDSYNHPRLPALMVALAYLTAVEGPLWSAVRGTGLGYDSGIRRSTESGLIRFSVYSSPDASKAFAAGKQVVESFISGKTPLDSLALEGAISSIALNLAEQQPSMVSAAQESFINQVIRNVPKNYSSQILKAVRNVTQLEIKEVLKDFVLPAFQPESSNLVVTCATGEQERIKQGFESQGFRVETKPLTYFQDDYGLKQTGDHDRDLDAHDEDEDDAESGDDISTEADEDEI